MDVNSNTASYKLTPPNPPNDGILFVDHSPNKRGGNLGHALVEYADGKILAFYPNCDMGNKGHSARGWMEYKRSEDYGQTWSDPVVLDYTKTLFDEGQAGDGEKFSAFGEKAVLTDEGHIVVFFLVCNITNDAVWRRFQIPKYIISEDGGHTWSEPYELCDNRGRLYDAKYYNGEILALHFKNDNEINFLGNLNEHVYQMYVSNDGGRTFELRSELPFDTTNKSYGTMCKLDSGSIIVYLYDK
ncbi:MAG: sialidase family protein, partial [Candidatus Latescibacteria bacterium]|nr:sialidase family protein [Candidatus Latescibacterota bacterium]